jgi:hypothetical protein
MKSWLDLFNLFMPITGDNLIRGQLLVVTVACAGLTLVIVALMVMWKISRDLQVSTVIYSLGLIAVLWVLWYLAYAGHVILSISVIVVMLVIILAGDVFRYRTEPLATSGFMLPITIAASGLGLIAGLTTAAFCTAIVWLFAYGERHGWFREQHERRRSYLTYNGPVLTVFYFFVGLISSVGFDYLRVLLR